MHLRLGVQHDSHGVQLATDPRPCHHPSEVTLAAATWEEDLPFVTAGPVTGK